MSVAVFGTDRLRFTSPGTRTTTLRFSHPNSARSNAQIQAALRARQVGAGIITVTDHNTANTVTVTITMPADAHQPADGSTDLWEWNDGTRTYRSGPLAWRWDTDRDPAVIDVDIAFGFGAQTFPAHTYRPGWGLGLTSDLTEAITGYRVSRLNPLREAKIVRGRSHELAAPQPARAVIVLDDTNGYTDPDNADAPAPYRTGGVNTLTAGLPIRMLGTAPGGVNEQIIFTGIIERIRQDYPGHTDERVVLECVDTYKLLGQGSVDATQPAVTSLDAAYQAVAADGGLPAIKSGSAPYNTSPSPVTRVGTAVAIESYIAEAGTQTAGELRNFERATASQLRISRDGSVEALMPSNFLELPGSYVDVSDDPTAALRYSDVEFARDDDRIINRVQVGSTSLVPDSGDVVSASQTAYGVRLLRVAESPLAPSLQVIWGIGVIRRWAQPVTRLQQMTLKPREVPNLWQHVLAVDVAEAWRVTRTSPVGKTRTVPLLTERVEHHITATDWTTKLQGTSVNPLSDTINTFTLTPGGTDYCVGDGEDLYLHRVFTTDTEVAAIGSAQVQIIAIGGGGVGGAGGATGGGGGGGAGGVVFSTAVRLENNDILEVAVGEPGADSSVMHAGAVAASATGGGAGGSSSGGGDGGSGGGGKGRAAVGFRSTSGPGGAGTAGQGHAGGAGRGDSVSGLIRGTGVEAGGGGGGGGFAAAGSNGFANAGRNDTPIVASGGGGGAGITLNITGTDAEYAVGGGGGAGRGGITSSSTPVAGSYARAGVGADTAGSGGGGTGRAWNGLINLIAAGGAGRDGLVVIRWRKDLADLNPGDLLPPPTTAPPTPTGLTATAATSSTVNASANTAARAASYQFRWREGNGSWTTVNAGGSPSATISGLGASTTYQVQVRATNSVGSSAWSSSVSVTTPAQTNPPATPTGLTVTAASHTRLDAACNAATGASGYRWRYRTGTGAWTTATTTSPARAITGLAASTTYEVQVQATNSAGSSDWSASVSATTSAAPQPPPTPTGFGLTTVSGEFTGAWDAVDGATSYQFRYREVGTSVWNTTAVAVTSRRVINRSDGDVYEAQVRARNAAGDSAWTATRQVTVGAAVTAPGVPVVTATPGDGQATVTWTDGTGGTPTSWRVFYDDDTSISGATEVSPRPTSRSVTITGLTNGTTYSVWVFAVNSAGQSAPSSAVTVTPTAAPVLPGAAAPTVAIDAIASGAPSTTVDLSATLTGGTYDTIAYTWAVSGGDASLSGADTATPTLTRRSDAGAMTVSLLVEVDGTGTVARAGTTDNTTATASATAATAAVTPSAVRDLAVTAGNAQFIATFTAPAAGQPTRYRLRYIVPPATSGHTSGVHDASPITITGLTNGTTYSVQVRAEDLSGRLSGSARFGPWSAALEVTPAAVVAAPPVPAGLSAQAGDASILVEWDPAARADEYVVEWTAGGVGLTATVTTTSHNITGLTNGTTYSIRVRASNSGGQSDWTTAVTATPAAAVVLPVAAAPTVTIAAIAQGAPSTTVDLSATVTGGTYDTLTYAWTVTGGDASLANAATATPTLTRRSDAGAMTISLTVTASGTGSVARDATSDTASDTENATVVVTLPVAVAPTVAIDTIASGAAGTTVDLSATLTGGTYDQLTYAWTVTGGDASIDDAAATEPTLTRRSTAGDSTVTLTITATGTGTVARDATSDTDTDTATSTALAASTITGPLIQAVRTRANGSRWDLLYRFFDQRAGVAPARYRQGLRAADGSEQAWNQEYVRHSTSENNPRWFEGIPRATEIEVYGWVEYADGQRSRETVVSVTTPSSAEPGDGARFIALDGRRIALDDGLLGLEEAGQ